MKWGDVIENKKGVLIINFPESCDKCDLLSEGAYCQGKKGENAVEYTVSEQKPDWCPVKPFPVKACAGIEVCIGNPTKNPVNYSEGYNACVDLLER